MNVDAAIDVAHHRMGLGCVMTAEKFQWRVCCSKRFSLERGVHKPNEVEALGVREALSWTKTSMLIKSR